MSNLTVKKIHELAKGGLGQTPGGNGLSSVTFEDSRIVSKEPRGNY